MPNPPSGFLDPLIYDKTIGRRDYGILHTYINYVAKDVATAWAKWTPGIQGGNLSVSGAGTPAWSGSGSGGKLSASPFEVTWTWPYQSKYWDTLNNAIGQELKKTFGDYIKNFSFSTVQFVGSCGATPPGVIPPAPGPISANAIPLAMQIAQTAPMAVDGIKDRIKARLPSSWQNAPGLNSLFLGIEDSIKKGMASVWLTSIFSGDSFSGVGAPSTGSGGGSSTGTGKVA